LFLTSEHSKYIIVGLRYGRDAGGGKRKVREKEKEKEKERKRGAKEESEEAGKGKEVIKKQMT
jgi:hypothetical protein